MSGNDLLTSGQVATIADVSRVTVHRWAREGVLSPTTKVNGIRLFKRSDVDKLVKARENAKAAS